MPFNSSSTVERNMICKALEELYFEEIIELKYKCGYFILELENIYYEFTGEKVAFDSLCIEEKSLKKYTINGHQLELDASFFFLEVQDFLGVDDIILSHFLSELQSTLFSDELVFNNQDNLVLKDLEYFSFNDLDTILDGHPKILLNKGRIGWGSNEIRKYAPESLNDFKLRWLLIHKCIVNFSISNEIDSAALNYPEVEYDLDNFLLVPVHPWQWENKLSLYFQKEIKNKKIIDLGLIGSLYKPQISLRTLSCTGGYDYKTSLSILNTSCYRGISSQYIEEGPIISQKVDKLIKNDVFLSGKVDVLRDKFNFHVPNPIFDQVKDAPYQFNECFGGVWRESVNSKIAEFERALPTAALTLKVSDGWFVLDLINQSGLAVSDWLKKYFEIVVIPLYHLQIKYGLGLVAHGQNTILVLRNHIPYRLIIKDFHGDLRLAQDSCLCDENAFSKLDRLPSHYLIHDLVTGHFITVLRYVAKVFQKNTDLTFEKFFYILGEVIEKYETKNNITLSKSLLMSAELDKVLVNKVRFKMGYSDTNERLKPLVGQKIKNPLLGSYNGVNKYV